MITKNAVNMMRNLFGKNAQTLNKGNIALRNCVMALGIDDVESVTCDEFSSLVEQYIEKSKVKPEFQIENWTFENLDDTWNGSSKSTVLKKGTVIQAKEYIEMLGKTEEFLAWVNR